MLKWHKNRQLIVFLVLLAFFPLFTQAAFLDELPNQFVNDFKNSFFFVNYYIEPFVSTFSLSKEGFFLMSAVAADTTDTAFKAIGTGIETGIGAAKNYVNVTNKFFNDVFSGFAELFKPNLTQPVVILSPTKPLLPSSSILISPPPVKPQTVNQTINQSVTERTIERIVSGITEEDLGRRLSEINDSLTSQLYITKTELQKSIEANFSAIALTQRINQITYTTISTPTITNPSITGGGASLDSLSVSGVATLTTLSVALNTTLTGNLNVGGNAIVVNGQINVGDKIITQADIGVGSTSPMAKLTVQSSNVATTSLIIWGVASQTAPHIQVFKSDGTEQLRLTAGGNVGIGTTSPGYKLSVAGSGYFDGGTIIAQSIIATSTLTVGTGTGFLYGTSGLVSASSTIGVSAGGTGQNSTDWTGFAGIANGTWSASTTLNVGYGGTGITSYTAGDMLYASSAQVLAKLAKATDGNILSLVNGLPSWIATTTITTLSNLSITSGQMSDIASYWDNRMTGTTTLPKITTLLGLTNASTTLLTVTGSTYLATLGGNVGIGTTTPAGILNLASTNPKLYLTDTNAVTDSKHWFINSADGLLSIGTTSDSLLNNTTLLTLGASSITDSIMSFYNSDAHLMTMGIDVSDANTFKIASTTDFSQGSFLAITAGGNVGVGTTSPNWFLSVSGNANFDNYVRASYFTATSTTATSTFPYLIATQSNVGAVVGGTWNGSAIDVAYGGTGLTSISQGQILVASAANTLQATSTLFIDGSNYRVGIGTTTPAGILNLASTNPKLYLTDTNAVTDSKHWFINSADGLLSIGTTSDSLLNNTTLLTLGASSITDSIMSFYNSDAHLMTMGIDVSDANTFKIASTTDFSQGSFLAITAGGNVGVGTSSPWRTFSVQGSMSLAGLTVNTGVVTASLCLDSNNEVTRNTDNETCVASSERFKEGILPMTEVLSKLAFLNPVSFKYIAGQETHYGFLAEEVEKIDPDLISYDSNGAPFGVKYLSLTAVLTKAVQEQQKQIEELKGRLDIALDGQGSAEQTTDESIFSSILNWLADKILAVKKIIVHDEICVGNTCVNEEQLKELLEKNQISNPSPAPAVSEPAPPVELSGEGPEGEQAPYGAGSSPATESTVSESSPEPTFEIPPEPIINN